jgi:nicotinate-nucleotide--dimethylbenzimidazole phosphoribosyltransferase
VSNLRKLLDAIRAPEPSAEVAATRHLDELTKPPGSLGRLEEIARRLAAVRGADQARRSEGALSPAAAPSVDRPVIFTLAADHGVAAEGVSAYPQAVTVQMLENFLRGGAAVNVLARQAGAQVIVADFGVVTPLGTRDGLLDRRMGSGTANMTQGPAMSRETATAAIEAGAALVTDVLDQRAPGAASAGADLIATGEMGIANTTAASAITAALTGAPIEKVTGRGTGIDAATYARKVRAIQRALEVNRPEAEDPVGVLATVGGFEIAGLVGVILAAAAHRLPVALDGFISGAAALVAVRLAPEARHALFASHRSVEPGHGVLLADLGLTPYLDLGMRLGEGTGAALFIHLARAAARIYSEMATFASAGVSGPDETTEAER